MDSVEATDERALADQLIGGCNKGITVLKKNQIFRRPGCGP